MSLEVIGTGLPRTGTESLKHALEILGFEKCYHMVELIAHPEQLPLWEAAVDGGAPDFETLFDGYRAAVDFPVMYWWRELIARYPAAQIVLTVRDPDAWYESLCNTVLAAVAQRPDNEPFTVRRRALVRRWLVDDLFVGRTDDRAFMLQVFERHREAVCEQCPPDRLLIFDARAGWEPLCAFLGRPVPDRAYPHGNATAQFREKYLQAE